LKEGFFFDEVEVPSGGNADVVVAVVVPVVVDVETLRIEVAHVDVVAVRVDADCSLPSKPPEIEVYRPKAYILSFLYFIREQIIFVTTSPRSEQEVLSQSFIARYRYP